MIAIHWFALFGLATLLSGLWAWKRAIDRDNNAAEREAHIRAMNRDWQEAFALWRYGAADEAIQCLDRCSQRVKAWEASH